MPMRSSDLANSALRDPSSSLKNARASSVLPEITGNAKQPPPGDRDLRKREGGHSLQRREPGAQQGLGGGSRASRQSATTSRPRGLLHGACLLLNHIQRNSHTLP